MRYQQPVFKMPSINIQCTKYRAFNVPVSNAIVQIQKCKYQQPYSVQKNDPVTNTQMITQATVFHYQAYTQMQAYNVCQSVQASTICSPHTVILTQSTLNNTKLTQYITKLKKKHLHMLSVFYHSCVTNYCATIERQRYYAI